MLAGVELGGTHVRVATAEAPDAPAVIARLATRGPAETLAAVVEALRAQNRAGGRIRAIGVASFGPLELDPRAPDFGRILATPKPDWSGADVLGALRVAFDAPCAIQTDVGAAALAEGALGAAEGQADHAYVTVGTGVGVGLVSGGRLLRGAAHPEAGHLPTRRRPGDVFPGACPFHGACVEGLISGPALAARLGRPAEALTADDPVWDLCGDYLAQLFLSLVLITAPRRIVLGGGVGGRPELAAAARRHLRHHLGGYAPRLDSEAAVADLVRPAALADAGLVGALVLAAEADRGSAP